MSAGYREEHAEPERAPLESNDPNVRASPPCTSVVPACSRIVTHDLSTASMVHCDTQRSGKVGRVKQTLVLLAVTPTHG
eukprot:3159429-Pyramimonas_sp.AAC.2